jgi:hypothetical protein
VRTENAVQTKQILWHQLISLKPPEICQRGCGELLMGHEEPKDARTDTHSDIDT